MKLIMHYREEIKKIMSIKFDKPKYVKFQNTYNKLHIKIILAREKVEKFYKDEVIKYTFERNLAQYKNIIDFDIINLCPKIKKIMDEYNRLNLIISNKIFKLDRYVSSNVILINEMYNIYQEMNHKIEVPKIKTEEEIELEKKEEQSKKDQIKLFELLEKKLLNAKKLDGGLGYKNQYEFFKTFREIEYEPKNRRNQSLLGGFINYLKNKKEHLS